MDRPPSEGSLFTNCAHALHGLRVYGPARDAKGQEQLHERVDKAVARGKEWLLKNKPSTMEDKVFHLRALVYTEAGAADIAVSREALLKEQKADGSWSQLPDLAGDAYATGSVLVALARAGLAPSDAAYQKGVKFLLGTQRPDGAWLVDTRSRPVQTFFDNGDPGGKSQFISFSATGWAVLALLQTIPLK
jgi:hypothetical protein